MAETIQFRVRGTSVKPEDAAQPKDVGGGFLSATVKTEVSVPVAARGVADAATAVSANADPETDVIELEFEGGIRQIVHPEQLRADLDKRGLVRGAEGGDGAVDVPSDFGSGASRGLAGDLALKALRVVGLDPVRAGAKLAVRAVISQFENKLNPAPGLYRIENPNNIGTPVSQSKELDSNAPYLLFLHGTASSIVGSFGALSSPNAAPSADWDDLARRYGHRVLALQHKTLSVSPLQNAIDVAELLPHGATLHLVSHSRGGLIGELLCLTDLQETHFRAFDAVVERADPTFLDQRKAEAANIRRMAELVRAKRFNVERFVRVACPARGTALASNRLDKYLSVILNVLGLIPGLNQSELYSFVQAVLLETANRRTDPRELPGIEAMMPESPLIHLLNQASMRSTGDLAVISGDLDAEGLWAKVALLAVDVLFGTDNDLVVDTRAMYAGIERARKASYFFNKGPHVNHFHYFRNPGTRGRLKEWLLAPPGTEVEGFRKFDSGQKVFQADQRREAATDTRPVAFVIPDLFGSQISTDGQIVWLSPPTLATRGLKALVQGEVSGLIPALYADLANDLQREYQVVQFAWDWRKPLTDSVQSLQKRVREFLDQKRRVCFVGHGAGGTLALHLAQDGDLWAKVSGGGGRLVLLGSPIASYPFLASLRDPQSRLRRMLTMIDPVGDDADAFFHSVADAQEGSLRSIEKAPPNALYIAGSASSTRLPHVDNAFTTSGDGHVTWEEPKSVAQLPAWRANAPHGNLVTAAASLSAIRDLLARGTTDKLPAIPNRPILPDGKRPTGEPLLYPTEREILDVVLGAVTETRIGETQPPLRVFVTHGDLRYAGYPVLVGHYHDDTIVNAEKSLDRALDGALTKRFTMGVYPGADDTSDIVLVEGNRRWGALVVGLGEVGDLTQEKLRRAVTSAVLRYAVAADSGEELGVSALLIGAYGELTIRESVVALIQGMLEANRQLKRFDGSCPRISALELIDLYEDVAIDAAHEVLTLAERMNGDNDDPVVNADQTIRTVEGGQSSRPLNRHQAGWWRRIKVEDTNGELEFTILTDRARAIDKVQSTQRNLVAKFVESAVGSTSYSGDLSSTLFQLLVPRTLRSAVADRVNLVLVLDRNSAQYPWELLAQRTRADVEPLATACGLLRQFRSANPEPRLPNATGKGALIVGDTNSGLVALKGARDEADAVQRLLSGYDVNRLPPDVDPLKLISELLSRPYRIIHLAAHGTFIPNNLDRSGMLIGKDLVLGARELQGMTSAPDLVFVNCCYLGGIERVPGPDVAANFAQTLMELGTKAVVVAGWAVDDQAAKTFADRFYDCMMSGETFGDATRNARQRTYELHPRTNTWGAYQCYGNPDFRLEQPSSQGISSSKRWYVAPQEVLQRIQQIAVVAHDETDKNKVRMEVEKLRQVTPVAWRDGDMLEAFGDAYAALNDNEEAIACYEQALLDETCATRVKLIRDLANLLDRTSRKKEEPLKSTRHKRAEDLLKALAVVTPTTEIWSILAALYKRDGAFEKARDLYDRSFHRRKQLELGDLFYPGVNAAAVAYVVNPEDDRTRWTDMLADSVTSAAAKRSRNQDFYSRVAVADALLVRSLWERTLDQNETAIIDAYKDVVKGGGKPNQFDSMMSQVRFLADEVDDPALTRIRDAVQRLLPR